LREEAKRKPAPISCASRKSRKLREHEGYPLIIMLTDAHFSQVMSNNSALDFTFACCPGTREPGSAPAKRRASEVRCKTRENRKFFDNSLPPVRIKWANLTEYNYLGETYRETDGTFVVLVDRRTNLRDEDLQDTVFHEMCHVATWRREDDPHGSAFRACMAGIKEKALQNDSMKAR